VDVAASRSGNQPGALLLAVVLVPVARRAGIGTTRSDACGAGHDRAIDGRRWALDLAALLYGIGTAALGVTSRRHRC
jgi:hypothetical protein